MIGLAGKAGAGKDYVLDLMQRESGHIFARVAFADGVRLEIEEVLSKGTQPIVPWDSSGNDHRLPAVWKKPYPDEVRALLQWWGTELRRAQDQDYWVKKGLARAGELENLGLIPVFTDVRFENEAKAIRAQGGIVLEVVASTSVRKRRLGGVLPPAHASEVIDFEVDGIIENHDHTLFPNALAAYLTRAVT